MKITAALFAVALAAASLAATAASADAATWNPEKWAGEDTLEFRSDCPDEGEHWSYVWLVVLDGDVWVRLGSQAGGRVECNRDGLETSIRVAGEEFAGIDMVPVPEMAERVAAAMADKYTTDIFVRWMSHPYTMKLVPKSE